jgi:hypothetical protein
MKNRIILMLFLALFITGCGGLQQRNGPGIISREVFKGTNGLIMEFQMTPEEVFEESPFRIEVMLKNDGAFDIEDGYLTLGLEKDFVELKEWLVKTPITTLVTEKQAKFILEGKSVEMPQGMQGITAMDLKSKNIEALREVHESTILLTSCYEYKTKSTEGVCIDVAELGTREVEKPCEVEDKKLGSQGAPVAITEIEVDMLPHEDKIKPQFIIHIENKGNGEVVKSGLIRQACSSEPIDYNDFNVVRVKASLFNKQLTCAPNDGTKIGLAKLKEKKDEIRCVLEEGISKEEGTRTESLNIELEYGYTSTISTRMDIKKIPS